ncbi:MAG: hypothetical protein COA78_15235 [Blastopirellula sp.]|nr:MAG: hypothetical protein COA78_15235 [Blastopirellula sp.]
MASHQADNSDETTISGKSPVADHGSQSGVASASIEPASPPTEPSSTASAQTASSPKEPSSTLPPSPAPQIRLAKDDQATVISTRDPESGDSNFVIGNPIPPAFSKQLIGETLGHFFIDAFVGAGGMGAVFRGHDTMLDRRVAVKILSQQHNANLDTVRRFKNEAQSAARLDHPNIARVYHVGEEKGWNYIVFEFIDGVNIRDLVERRGPMSIEESLAYTLQISEALQHAFERDIVHRDIKPSNVMINTNNKAKLVDMGLARLHQVDSSADDLTASGVTLGTFDYISPEQARDPRTADVRSDLYSLGCTLYYMLTGRPPFPDGTVLQKLLSHSGETAPDPREFRPDVPDEVAILLSRLMTKNPNDRYQTPSELIGEMLMMIEDLGIAVPHGSGAVLISTGPAEASAIEKHLPWVVPVITLLLVTFVMDWVWEARGNDSYFVFNPRASTQLIETAGGSDVESPTALDASDSGKTEGDTTSSSETISPIPFEGGSIDLTPLPGVEESTEPDSSASGPTEEPMKATDTNSGASASPVSPTETNGTETVDPAVVEPKVTEEPLLAKNVLLVPDQYPTLYDAVVQASANPEIDTIELRFNGEQLFERPLQLNNVQLKIRAGDGFSPQLRFAPNAESALQDMFSILRGSVEFEQLHFVYDGSQVSDINASVMLLEQTERITISECSLTVIGQMDSGIYTRPGLSVFRLKDDVFQDVAMRKDPVISLKDTVVRGETNLLSLDQSSAFRFFWDNGLLAISGNLLNCGGASEFDMQTGYMQVDLTHVTARAEQGLFQLTTSPELPHQLNLKILMTNCIASWNTERAMLSQTTSFNSIPQIQEFIGFVGNENCYDLQEGQAMWEVRLDSDVEEVEVIDYRQWLMHWEKEKLGNRTVLWNQPVAEDLFSAQTKENYTLLEDRILNPAYRPKEDNSGAFLKRLPVFPELEVDRDEIEAEVETGALEL